MRKTRVLLGLGLAAAAVVACSSSSGPTTYVVSGACGPLPVTIANPLMLNGPCNLGAAGNYTLAATLQIELGRGCGNTQVGITANWVQGSSEIASTFGGGANLPCLADGGVDLLAPIPISGTFTYDGGTGTFATATGSAFADGGVTANISTESLNANFSVVGSLTY
jgi:hypothetical protein